MKWVRNYRAAVESFVVAFFGAAILTWVDEAGSLKEFNDLFTFVFVTKAVSKWVLLTGMNAYLANKTYKGDPVPVIEARIKSDISELKNKPLEGDK